ncbi:MAG: hypothetical protein WD971_09600 [Pirellulales bacterium]
MLQRTMAFILASTLALLAAGSGAVLADENGASNAAPSAKSPAERYADAKELEQALAACSAAGEWDARRAAVWWHDVCFAAEKQTMTNP